MIRSRRMFAYSRRAAIVLGCSWLAALGGCGSSGSAPGLASRIPEFARPQRLTGEEKYLTDDLIPYRKLRRDDFRASHPPPSFGENAAQMGAITCATIRSRPGARFTSELRGADIEVGIEGLEFEAMMDRGCSWWNDAREVYSSAYMLEHEQVHLALFEVEARRLTRRLTRARISARRGVDPDELAARMQRRIDGEVESATRAVLERSLRFDEDTSLRHRPALQRRWFETLEAELRDLPR